MAAAADGFQAPARRLRSGCPYGWRVRPRPRRPWAERRRGSLYREVRGYWGRRRLERDRDQLLGVGQRGRERHAEAAQQRITDERMDRRHGKRGLEAIARFCGKPVHALDHKRKTPPLQRETPVTSIACAWLALREKPVLHARDPPSDFGGYCDCSGARYLSEIGWRVPEKVRCVADSCDVKPVLSLSKGPPIALSRGRRGSA